jgi:hypothetical protein
MSSLLQVAQREGLVSNAEIARFERDLGQARTAALSSGAGIQPRLQALQIACVPSLIASAFHLLMTIWGSGTENKLRRLHARETRLFAP